MSKSSEFAASIGAKLTEPSVPITDKAFKWTNASQTNIRARFDLIRSVQPKQPQVRRVK